MITKILDKYKACHNYYPKEDIQKDEVQRTASVELENKLQEKWKGHIHPGWYGFSMAPCPESWLHIIDEFLNYLVTVDPNFEVHQIKVKFGGLRFYISYKIEDEELAEFIRLQIDKLEWTLYDERLIY